MINNNLQYFSDKEFAEFAKFIHSIAGINLTEKKKSLVNNRLRKRVMTYNFTSYIDYFNFIKAPANSAELITCINEITTNVSSFFRDPRHNFKHLLKM